VGGQRPIDNVSIGEVSALAFLADESAHDSGRTKSALARASSNERIYPSIAFIWLKAIDRHDGPTSNTASWGHTSDPGCAVDQNSAASTLTLRRTAVFDTDAPYRPE